MSSEPQKENQPENQERSEREATFSRRGLLQWSVPAILAVTLPSQVSAGSHMDHGDGHGDHTDHGDSHQDNHDDSHQDSHQDDHKDSHDDHFVPKLRSGQVPNFSTTTAPAGRSGSGVVPNYSAPGGAPSVAPGQGGSGAVPRFNPPKR